MRDIHMLEVIGPMATNTYVELRLREAKDLADLTGMETDLEVARAFANLLRSVMLDPKSDRSLIEPLSTAVLVRYSRPFSKGMRGAHLAVECLNSLTASQLKAHNHIRLFRDKHIAHSVNAYEDNYPIARYWVERLTEEGFTSVECNHTRISGLNSDEIGDVLRLSDVFLKHIRGRLKQEKERVLAVVRGMPIDKVLRAGQKLNVNDRIRRAKVDKARRG